MRVQVREMVWGDDTMGCANALNDSDFSANGFDMGELGFE